MQQPLEERVASLETAAERHEQTLARLDSIVENHDQLLDRILANQEATARLLEEVIHDAATTRRLWLRLAQRYGWLDDEQTRWRPAGHCCITIKGRHRKSSGPTAPGF